MVILVRLLGIFITIFAVAYLLNPNIIKPYMAFWKKPKRLYAGGVLSLLIGIIFLRAASQCRISWLVAAFAILAVIKGIVLFIVSQEKAISMLNWWTKRPIAFLRAHGLFALVIGLLLIYSA